MAQDYSGVRNFVFDMGGVLMDFDTTIFDHLYVESDEDAKLIGDALYRGFLWPLLDAGAVSEGTVEFYARQRVPQRLWEPMHRGFAEWELHQPSFPAMNALVERLHAQGYGCYLLSNAGVRWWKQKDHIPCMHAMDGFVVSAFEHVMKPDPIIYAKLCSRYGLEPASCLFVDDNKDNCQGAERAGMLSYHYDGDAEKFQAALAEGGVWL